jgi:hypothetical protein
LKIDRCDDGDILLRQGDCCGCGDDVVVRLHPAFHFSLIAEYMGLMTRAQFESATAKSNDRLQLMAGLINASLPSEHPLVVAAGVLLGVSPTLVTQQSAAAVANGQQSARQGSSDAAG